MKKQEGMPLIFDRRLNRDFLDLLKPGAPLHFLITDFLKMRTKYPYALDLQIRQDSELHVYHGRTVLLSIRGDSREFTLSASEHYGQTNRASSAAYRDIMGTSDQGGMIGKRAKIKDYICKAIESTHPHFFGEGNTEGFWQNQLCRRFGTEFNPDDPWLVIDRECVFGAGGDHLASLLYKYNSFLKWLRAKWHTFENRRPGGEADLFVIDKQGNLLCVELKYGSHSPEQLYWGPLQVSLYRDMAAKASEILFRSLKTIIDQKVELGLLQPQAKERFPEKRFKEIRAVLAIAMPLASPRAKRWQNLKDVLAQCPDGAPDVVFISGKGNEAIDIPGFKNAPWIYV